MLGNSNLGPSKTGNIGGNLLPNNFGLNSGLNNACANEALTNSIIGRNLGSSLTNQEIQRSKNLALQNSAANFGLNSGQNLPTFNAKFTPLSNNIGSEIILGNNFLSSIPSNAVITEIVPNLQLGDVTVNGDLPIGGSIKICGCFPVYGIIAVDGSVPSAGTAVVNTGVQSFAANESGCRCGN